MRDRSDAFSYVQDRIGTFLTTGGHTDAHITVALSGGADSVCLFRALCALRERLSLTVSAIHVHHGIRGEEADEDLAFCRALCADFGVELTVEYVDAPAYAEMHHMSLESAARSLRYACFETHHATHEDTLIATAHHADDNAETVLFRMARGTGLRGLCGIPAYRDFYIRPCLSLRAEELRAALLACGAVHREDSTNRDTAYTRNFIRHDLLPLMERVHEGAVENISLMTEGLCEDEAYLMSQAEACLRHADGHGLRSVIAASPPAIAKRMLWLMYEDVRVSEDAMTSEQMGAALALIRGGTSHARMSLPCGIALVIDRGDVTFCSEVENKTLGRHEVTLGVNLFPETGECLILSEKPVEIVNDCSLNIYKLLIHSTLRFDTMDLHLYVRAKEDGDTYRYGGMTRSLKKLFNDKKLSLHARAVRPVLCDEAGILWVPGFGVREDVQDDEKREGYRIYACYCGLAK